MYSVTRLHVTEIVDYNFAVGSTYKLLNTARIMIASYTMLPGFDCGGCWVGEEVTLLIAAGSWVGEGEKGLSEMVGDEPARRLGWQTSEFVGENVA